MIFFARILDSFRVDVMTSVPCTNGLPSPHGTEYRASVIATRPMTATLPTVSKIGNVQYTTTGIQLDETECEFALGYLITVQRQLPTILLLTLRTAMSSEERARRPTTA